MYAAHFASRLTHAAALHHCHVACRVWDLGFPDAIDAIFRHTVCYPSWKGAAMYECPICS